MSERRVTWHRIEGGDRNRAALVARDEKGRVYVRPQDLKMDLAATTAGATVPHPRKVPVRHYVSIDWMIDRYLKDDAEKDRWRRIREIITKQIEEGAPVLSTSAR